MAQSGSPDFERDPFFPKKGSDHIFPDKTENRYKFDTHLTPPKTSSFGDNIRELLAEIGAKAALDRAAREAAMKKALELIDKKTPIFPIQTPRTEAYYRPFNWTFWEEPKSLDLGLVFNEGTKIKLDKGAKPTGQSGATVEPQDPQPKKLDLSQFPLFKSHDGKWYHTAAEARIADEQWFTQFFPTYNKGLKHQPPLRETPRSSIFNKLPPVEESINKYPYPKNIISYNKFPKERNSLPENSQNS